MEEKSKDKMRTEQEEEKMQRQSSRHNFPSASSEELDALKGFQKL